MCVRGVTETDEGRKNFSYLVSFYSVFIFVTSDQFHLTDPVDVLLCGHEEVDGWNIWNGISVRVKEPGNKPNPHTKAQFICREIQTTHSNLCFFSPGNTSQSFQRGWTLLETLITRIYRSGVQHVYQFKRAEQM